MTNLLYRRAAWLWLVIILALASYSIHSLFIQDKIQFNVLALLPEGKTEPMRAVSDFMKDTELSNRVVILLGHKDPKLAKAALQYFRKTLQDSALKEQNVQAIAQDYKKLFTQLYPYRAGLLSAPDQMTLEQGHAAMLAKRGLAEALFPLGTFRSGQVSSDPFSLYPQFVTSLYSALSIQRDAEGDLLIESAGTTWYLFQGTITESAFSLKLQKELTQKLSATFTSTALKDVQILKTGALFYAAKGAEQAHQEISKIGLISILGIICLMLIIFRTIQPILFAIAVVVSGFIGGLAVCFYLFGSIHILALVFGCSLIGVAVDYALYFFCASYLPLAANTPTKQFRVLSLLMPALPLAVLASSIGYIFLMAVPFPGIQQMATFACAGLFCTFLSVCLWGEYFVKAPTQQATERMQAIQQRCFKRLAGLGKQKYHRLILSLLLLSIFCLGMFHLTFDDQVRHFQSLDVALKTQEDKIKSMMKIDNSGKFLAVQANNLQEMLEIEEAIMPALNQLQLSYKATAQLLPSEKRQQQNRYLLETQLYAKHYQEFMQTLGLKNTFDKKALGLTEPLLMVDQQMLKSLPTGWRELTHYSDKGLVTGRMVLSGTVDPALIQKIVDPYPSVNFIDPAQEYSNLFADYRKIMTALVFGVLLGFAVLLALKNGVKTATMIIFPVFLAMLATVGIISLLGSFTLFHAMGLMLVLCIGIDYALFLYWYGDTSSKRNLRLLGNGLAASTTILSFGLLALSKTAAVHNFGLTVFLGITLCFFVTTFFLGKHEH
jgi:predicted exporter